MAVKTSNGTGAWSTGGTWVGGVAPAIGTDTVVIASGHTVTYDLSDGGNPTPCLQITVNGILKFDTTQSTKLTMGNASIIVSSTGELQIGTLGYPLSQSYTAQILWTLTTDGTYGITVASGGKLTMYGDSGIYGSNPYCYIADYCEITGTLVTDATGLYFHDDTTYPAGYNGHKVYVRTDYQYYIWFDATANCWKLTVTVGSTTPYCWYTTGSSLGEGVMHPTGDSFGEATVINGWQATDSKKTLSVIGPTTSWANGQKILIYNNNYFGTHANTDYAPFGVGPATIDTVTANSYHSNYTDIAITESTYSGNYNTGGIVHNLTRNIQLGKSGAAWTTTTVIADTPTNRPILTDVNTVLGNVNLNNVMLTGFYKPLVNASTTTTYASLTDTIFRHCELMVFTHYYGTLIRALMYSCTRSGINSYSF